MTYVVTRGIINSIGRGGRGGGFGGRGGGGFGRRAHIRQFKSASKMREDSPQNAQDRVAKYRLFNRDESGVYGAWGGGHTPACACGVCRRGRDVACRGKFFPRALLKMETVVKIIKKVPRADFLFFERYVII